MVWSIIKNIIRVWCYDSLILFNSKYIFLVCPDFYANLNWWWLKQQKIINTPLCQNAHKLWWRCLCAKYFDKQTHSCAECNYVIFVLKKSEVKVVGIILLTSWLMVHHGCCTVGGLLYGATRLIFRCRVQGKCRQNIKWNTNWSARSKHSLYLINTHNNFHSSLSAFKYCRVL